MKEVHWFTGILFAATGPVIPLYYDGYIDQKWSMTAIVVSVSIVYVLLSRSTLRLDRRPLANASSLITVYLCSYTCLSYFLKGPVLTGPFENPNVLSLHLCLLLPLVHEGVRQTEGGKRIAHVILETVSVLTIIATGCRSRVGVCWKSVLMAYGEENWDFPDPRCPKSPLPFNEIYIK